MSQLHELLAVEQDLRGQAQKMMEETKSVFAKQELFRGAIESFTPFNEAEAATATSKREELATTVEDRLAYTAKAVAKYWDAVLQKERTNQAAKSDIEVDGLILAKDVPATMLLGLEARLTAFREAIAKMPTLDAKVAWVPANDVRAGAYVSAEDDIKFRTKKIVEFTIAAQPTKEHPAQVKEVSKDITIGKIVTKFFSGAVTSARASEILGRTDRLLEAVKRARQRANKETIIKGEIGNALMGFILAK